MYRIYMDELKFQIVRQDAIAKISEADNFNELRKAISESVSSIWSSVCSVVYIADSQDLYLKENRQEAIPHTGIARECLESKEVRNCSNCSSDPIFKALSQHNHFHHDKTSYVSCIPIVDHVSSSVIGVVAIGSIYELSNFDSFDSIKDQIVGCYRRLCKCQRGNSYTPANPSLQNSVSLNGPSDPRDALLRLCGDLYDQDATVLQLKINRFLEEQTNSDCAFHLLVVPETDDLICQGQNSIFSTALETKKPISLQDTPLDKRKDIEDFLGFTVKSLLCVPVICKNHEGLLALACVTNKDNSDRFSNEDIQIILQCFQYTSTILRSTLAFQNERKLKLQTQAMLQVARNLFTHLDNIESKPELNYAFLSDSLQSNVDNKVDEAVDEETENCRSRVILGFDDVIQGSRIDIVVEDTDTDDRVTLSMHKVSTTMPGNVSHVSEVKRPCGSFEETRQKDYNIVKDYHPPSYDDDIITFDDLTKLLREIMQEARNLTQAERCSVFLIDKETDELVAKVFDGITTNDSEEQTEIRMPSTRGIAGHVATTGTLLNIKDAYSHPLFFRGIDDSTGFKTRNILCFPIKNEKGDVLGVAQLCNKKNGPYFTTFDEEVASAFAVYCCISISHSLMYQNVIAAQIRNNLANELMMYHMKCLMYKKLQLSQHRNRLTNELMIYHMQVSYEDVLAHVQNEIPPTVKWSPDFDKFPYPPREIPENDTTLACLTMFEDLGFITRWRIKKETLIRFTLMVKKGYRNPPYHNWMHAFAVAHFCYLCIKNLNLTEYLDDLEMFALFVSCLGHDIDHRGTNNQYQVASKSVLAALYSSEGSVMERHHFAQTMCIVNTEGCNIFENLPSKDYTAVLDLVRDIILATDLAHHLKILGNLKEMASEGYDKTNIKHHKMLLCLLMTASDLSDQTKPWDFTKHVAALIYREFFSQGDLEKALGQRPIEMMDRERARIPDLQIGFLDHIALPVYRVLGDIFPSAESVTNTVVDNRRHWEKICALIKIRRGGSCEQMSYDQILALEEEEADAEIESYQLKQQQAEQNGR
ncbi:hypothetical protein FSP39_002735 [Pinctada imbricata]|uniref:Phosphodiesterase n=1 Tax=Pinctada imbricata TaxID=66713 RepID=A0AA88YDE1_PINIB|nr:hypothetical protein FSP39_002735 [Pinctada imbricata]